MTENISQTKRKMAFTEVGDGVLFHEAQHIFEKCQAIALDSRQAVKMVIKLDITPPRDGDRFGKTQYSIAHTVPSKKSIEFTTEYSGGYAVRDGLSVESITQLNLELKDN